MLRTLVNGFGLLSLVGLVLALWHRHDLPTSTELNSALFDDPVQIESDLPPFQTTRKDVVYTVKPLYDYELYGLVVSKHDANAWWDYVHDEWSDNLNVMDLCVIWGKTASSGAYANKDISYSSGQWTCYFQSQTQEAYQAFDIYALSNNHLLTDVPQLIKTIRDVEVGDQIHFHGSLAEYSHNNGFPFKRGSSTTRTDTGNGACETVFLDRFEIIKTGNSGWRKLQSLSMIGLMIYLIAWYKMPVRNYYR